MIRNGQLVPAPGAIAKVYENFGAKVENVGKPHSAIFRHALAIAATRVDARVIMIGDSPEHDLGGGKALGLSTLLVRTGIHQSITEPELLRVSTTCCGRPDFLAAAFRW
jgi:ribonucleotide monophosphatase NagD (HAD superfamily)